MPFLPIQFAMLNRLTIPWEWHVVMGTARPRRCTSWCRAVPEIISDDGSLEFMQSLATVPGRITLYNKPAWDGKLEMVNHPLQNIKEPGLLWQLDADEIWTPQQIECCRDLFLTHPEKSVAWFWCRFFLGPDIVVSSRKNWGNHKDWYWTRVWRFVPGQEFVSHEPPVMTHPGEAFSQDEMERYDLVFDHYAYLLESQVRFKEAYYGYPNLTESWKALQANTEWPVKVNKFLPFVLDDGEATRL